MRLREAKPRPRAEDNLIPLINIVFLILIFFLVASTIKPFSNRQIELAESSTASSSAVSARLLIVRSDGVRFVGGSALTDDDLRAQLSDWSRDPDVPITVVADRATKASELIATATLARTAGIKSVKLLTRRVR